MIPSLVTTSEVALEQLETQEPSLTYALLWDRNRVTGKVDEKEAVKQFIYKSLNTERFDHPQIYSQAIGFERKSLIGKPIDWVMAEVDRRIKEALLWDDRITSVDKFKFTIGKKSLHVEFTVITIFGAITIDMEVQYGL